MKLNFLAFFNSPAKRASFPAYAPRPASQLKSFPYTRRHFRIEEDICHQIPLQKMVFQNFHAKIQNAGKNPRTSDDTN